MNDPGGVIRNRLWMRHLIILLIKKGIITIEEVEHMKNEAKGDVMAELVKELSS